MILTDSAILDAIHNHDIKIECGYNPDNIGSNSYDVHLSDKLGIYVNNLLDSKRYNEIEYITIPEEGIELLPGELYLGSTVERIGSDKYVPILEDKSSVGRLGIGIHITAGFGDLGFINHWTLEITCVKPVRIYHKMAIGQMVFHDIKGECKNLYSRKANAKYNEHDVLPVASMYYKNFNLR